MPLSAATTQFLGASWNPLTTTRARPWNCPVLGFRLFTGSRES